MNSIFGKRGMMMRRDRAQDGVLFCDTEMWEYEYVAGLYPREYHDSIITLLRRLDEDSRLGLCTHMEVFRLIEEAFRLPVPE
jgi:hypothetical protein